MSEITQVITEADYDTALARISELLGAEPYSAEDEELDRISTLVEIYEAEHYPMEDPYPSSFIEFLIDQQMVSRENMEALAGGKRPAGRDDDGSNADHRGSRPGFA